MSGSDERIASALVEADALLGSGHPLDAVVRTLGISKSTYYRWRRLRDLEVENTRLRRIVADNALEIEMLREISRGTY